VKRVPTVAVVVLMEKEKKKKKKNSVSFVAVNVEPGDHLE
jgi:hypoxanthine-guanine phosphoribosyltransferase